jgi:hypothetical protein
VLLRVDRHVFTLSLALPVPSVPIYGIEGPGRPLL